jgi:hypothetical protein
MKKILMSVFAFLLIMNIGLIIAAPQNTDTALWTAITTEITERASADTALWESNAALWDAVHTETIARASVDTELGTAINTETIERASADTTLLEAIFSLTSLFNDSPSQIDSFFDVFVEWADTDNWDKDVSDDITECSCPITQQQYDDITARLLALEGEECIPTTEICDGLDNDCDDEIDEENVCGTCTPTEEVCDGIDNDCDGEVDEDFPESETSCDGTDSDLCADGFYECTSGFLSCADDTEEHIEICDDSIDNDCDGEVDEECSMEGESCDDGNACTYDDEYDSQFACVGISYSCDDDNVCTTDSCNPSSGCVQVYNTNSCDDYSACTMNDVCSGGSCMGGEPADCNDDNVCTTDTCDHTTGCAFIANTNSCDDGLFCNGEDVCSAGMCTNLGTILPCDGPDDDDDCAESCSEGNNDCSANDPVGSSCLNGTCSSDGECAHN